MEKDPQKSKLSRRFLTHIRMTIAAWTIIVGASFLWDLYSHKYVIITGEKFRIAVGIGYILLWILVSGGILALGRQWKKTIDQLHDTMASLQQTERRQRALLDAIPDLLFVFNREGRYLDVGGTAHSPIYKQPEEMLGKTLLDVLPKDLAQERLALIQKVLDTGEPQSFEYWIPLQDEERFFEGRIVPGSPDEVLFITRDITEKKEAADKLRRLKEFNESIVQRVSEGIVVQDLDGRFSFVNPAAAELLGYTVEELTGQCWTTIVPPDQRQLVKQADERRKAGISDHYELELLRKDGSRVIVLTSGNPMLVDGEYAGTMAVFTDIRAQKEAEAALENANDELEYAVLRANELAVAAEKANQAKSEFLATMSHEIRTPMNGIIGMTELALSTSLTAEQREYLTAVQTSAEALLGIINDILDFSKIEAGKLELEEIDFDLRDTVEKLGDILSPRALEKNLELLIYVEPTAITAVRGDPLRLRQIMVNLVGNAIKFTDEGEVRVEAKMLNATDDTIEMKISVIDTGIGIPEEKQTLIFETFSQADSTTTRKYGGTGLGLAISRQLVEMMGGSLWVESEYGRGSVFNFTVLLTRQPTALAPDAGDERLRDIRVLVVDDNASSRRILASTLEAWGCPVEEAADGTQALRQLEHALDAGNLFDVVLLDVQMPQMNGIEVLQTIRQTDGLGSLPVVMLPMVNTLREVINRRDLAWADYVTKPVKYAELMRGLLVAIGAEEAKEPTDGAEDADPDIHISKTDVEILLVEDNEINRRLAVAMLEREGYRLQTAENGKIALAMLEAHPFDLILMDVQMPEMNGLEATAAIRANPAWADIPIIAMTAHALEGDREYFISAGMNDYVTKPIRTKEVTAAIARQLTRIATDDTPAPPDAPEEIPIPPANDILDPSGPLEWFGGDVKTFAELLAFFLVEAEGYLDDLSAAIAGDDAHAVTQIAHKLKGAAANMGASQVQYAAFALEKMGKAGELADAPAALETLRDEFSSLKNYCQPYMLMVNTE